MEQFPNKQNPTKHFFLNTSNSLNHGLAILILFRNSPALRAWRRDSAMKQNWGSIDNQTSAKYDQVHFVKPFFCLILF